MPCADSALRRSISRCGAVQTPGAACSSGTSGSFQYLQPPQLWPANQLPQLPSIRAIDADAGSGARKRRPERRPQSALSNRRGALGATGPEACILTVTSFEISRNSLISRVSDPNRSSPRAFILNGLEFQTHPAVCQEHMSSLPRDLTDAQWARPWRGRREVLDGILFILRTAAAWADFQSGILHPDVPSPLSAMGTLWYHAPHLRTHAQIT